MAGYENLERDVKLNKKKKKKKLLVFTVKEGKSRNFEAIIIAELGFNTWNFPVTLGRRHSFLAINL